MSRALLPLRSGLALRRFLMPWILLGLPFPAVAAAQADPPPTGPTGGQTVTVIAGPQYADPPGGQRWLLGDDYRDLWTEPIEVEVLDLRGFADGLVPVMRVGGMQTLGLAMKGGDGRDYTFRSIDKVYSPETIPPSFQGTFIEDVIQDQIAANLPGVQVVTPPIERAAGVLGLPDARLVLMPDDSALGEFQEDFAGVLGVISEFPQPVSEENPGFRGAVEILSSEEFWEVRRAGAGALPDTRAFLRARLLDLLFNDWDRHHGQWRWARLPEHPRLQPIPEDRDQVFTDFRGLLLDLARTQGAQFVKLHEEFEPLRRVIKNGWDVDRAVLTDIERDEWLDIAGDVQRRLTDEVLAEGLERLPVAYYRLRGDELAHKLRSRRDRLVEMAEEYYGYLSREVDIQGTDADELVLIESFEDGSVELRLSLTGGGETSPREPYYERRFRPEETSEIRLYLHAGRDSVVTLGPRRPEPGIRVVAGPGGTAVDDSRGFGVRLYADGHPFRIFGKSGSEVDERPYAMPTPEVPNDTPGVPAQDWGGFTKPLIIGGYQSDPGVILGTGLDAVRHGFRAYPWARRHVIRGAFAFGVRRGFAEYVGRFRRENARLGWSMHARFSGLDQFRYYGLGNETLADRDDAAYRISSTQVTVFPGLDVHAGEQGQISFGPILRYTDSRGTAAGTVLAEDQPLGAETFGQIGARVSGRFDSRAKQSVLNPGFLLEGQAAYYPGVWDAPGAFGYVDAHVGGWLRLADPLMLSLHVRGRTVWGDAPYFEAAYVGGQQYPLGTKWNRWAGDASLGGLASLRWTFARFRGFVPGSLGLFGMGNAARVFVDGERSSKWHPSAAGGIFITSFDRSGAFHIGGGSSPEDGLYFLFMASFAALPLQ